MGHASRRVRRSLRKGLRRWGRDPYDLGDRTGSSRFLKQTVVSLVLLALVLAIQELPPSVAGGTRDAVRWVVTRDTDLVAALRRLPTTETLARGDKPLLPFLSPLLEEEKEPETQTMAWPMEGRIISGFGWRSDLDTGKDHFHEGLDIEAPLGTPVMAVMDGQVSGVVESPTYGNLVTVLHGAGLETAYAHLSEVLVRSPQPVKQGDIIGRVGQTGNALTPHLHFEVREEGVPVDPAAYLGKGEQGP
jgi:murein DD-endopeptidase MepM/ murein hydrolase activator NlpD